MYVGMYVFSNPVELLALKEFWVTVCTVDRLWEDLPTGDVDGSRE